MNIEQEIDNCVDKIASQLKTKLKSAVIKYEKGLLKQWNLSQKESQKESQKVSQKVSIQKKHTNKQLTKKKVSYDSDESSE